MSVRVCLRGCIITCVYYITRYSHREHLTGSAKGVLHKGNGVNKDIVCRESPV